MNRHILPLFMVFLTGISAGQGLPDSLLSQAKRVLAQQEDGFGQMKTAFNTVYREGSPGVRPYAKMEEFMMQHLRSKGLPALEFQLYTAHVWTSRSSRLEIVPYKSDHYVPVEAVSLPGCGSGDGIWRLVDGGDAWEAGMESLGPSLKGKCLMLNLVPVRKDSSKPTPSLKAKLALAQRFGAVAVLVVCPSGARSGFRGFESDSSLSVPVPVLGISMDDGRMIRDWLKSGARLMAEIKLENQVAEYNFKTITSFVPASVSSRETLVFCSHIVVDPENPEEGFPNHWAGAFALSDAAAALARLAGHLKRNIVFVWTMGVGGAGPGIHNFIREWQRKNPKHTIRLAFATDLNGPPTGVTDFGYNPRPENLKSLLKKVKVHVPSFPGIHVPGMEISSGVECFIRNGVPVWSLVSEPLPPESRNSPYGIGENSSALQEVLSEASRLDCFLALGLAIPEKCPIPIPRRRERTNWLQILGLKENP